MTSTQWANIGEDAGALHELVQQLPEHIALPLIDCLWIFPARRIAAGESIVIVVAARDADHQRRRVMTAHFTVARNRRGVAQVSVLFDEHGTAPEAAVPRIIQGVLRRLGEEVGAEPREEQISGDRARWDSLVVELGGRIRADEAEDDTAAEEHATAHDTAVGNDAAAAHEVAAAGDAAAGDDTAAGKDAAAAHEVAAPDMAAELQITRVEDESPTSSTQPDRP